MPRGAGSETVLVRAPFGRDAELTCAVLRRHGLEGLICDTVEELCRLVEEEAACAILAEEALDAAAVARLVEVLTRQPPWSDFPLIVLRASSADPVRSAVERLLPLGNVTMLDRPVKARSMVAAVEVALRGRRRQYAARRAIQQRDDFLAMLGHELRNPLGGVVLAAEMIKRSAAGRSPDIERHLGVIDRQTKNLTRLVEDLLDVSRVTSGKVVLKREPLAIDDVLARSVQLVEQEAQARSLDLELFPAGAEVRVDGDPVRLEQVFGNLLKNAIKYSPPGARITVTARAGRDACELSVRDTGIGMTPEMLATAFELFSQAARSLDRSQGGLGIGLTMVRSLVELHGGTVAALSDGPGQGTEIIVRLPRLAAGALAEPDTPLALAGEATQVDRMEPLSVVLIEDNEDLRTTSQELLEALGCQVDVASDGVAGLARILETRPDVALVDIGLPTMDGYGVAAQVRNELGRDPVLVALTGYGQPQDRERALAAGFDMHLTKPVSVASLRQALSLRRASRE